MKKLLFKMTFVIIAMIASLNASYGLTIDKQVGWLESAYVTWKPVTNAASYNVYYSGEGITNKRIDTQLIRSYGTYFRADVLGLTAGNYTMTVKAVNAAGTEFEEATSSSVSVVAHDRNGFAFYGGRIPGAYKMDGTPKDNAVILYVSAVNEDTLTLNVVTSSKGTKTLYTGIQAIFDGFKKGYDTRPLIVRFLGKLNAPKTGDGGGDFLIQNDQNTSSYITVEGVGNDATVNEAGIRIKTATNIEIRNLGAMNVNSTAGDDFGMQQDNDYCWIHNCDMFYGDAGSDADQVKGDGAMDIKGANYCTFDYNHFWDNGKANLLGLSEGTSPSRYVTYHHNWYDHSDSRHPRVRFYNVHFYNNYLDGNAKYGCGASEYSSLFVEGNYYRDCKHPMMISMQGTDIWNGTTQKNDKNFATFSGEDGGMIKAYNNVFDQDGGTNDMRFVPYGDTNPNYNIPGIISSTSDFDAYVVTNRNDPVPSTVVSKQGSHTYSNFDTNLSCYISSLTLDAPTDAVTKIKEYAGRVEGGDFQWTFNNSVDDASYLVNAPLKQAITNYTSSLVYVQGINSPVVSTSQTLTLTSGSNTQTVNYGSAITPIVYTYGGTATSASVSSLDGTGLSATVDAAAQTVTISGTPTLTANYTLTTAGTSGTAVALSGKIIVIAQTLTLTSATGTDAQTVQTGSAITPIVYTYGGTATSASVTGLDGTGLVATMDDPAKTITISGIPTASVSYTVTTTGTGETATATGTVTASDGSLTLTSGSNTQTVVAATAINPIVYTWGGTATGVIVDGLDGTGLSVTTDANAKSVTISGTPTATANYTVSTQGASVSISLSGTVTVTNQTLVLTSGSASQTVTSGTAITPVVYTYGGIATGATVSNLPLGLSSTIDATAQTLTISGTPTATGTYTVTSTGTAGTAVSLTGTITVNENSDMIHNFTSDGIASSYYTITGNLSTSYGTVSYNGLTLTQCLKMESSTNIAFTSTASGTLTLVFNGAKTGTITIDGTTYSVTSSGIVTVALAAGAHTIKKLSGSTYLFYMSMVYDASGINANAPTSSKLVIYPNPVVGTAYINRDASTITHVAVFSISGILVKQFAGGENSLNLSDLNNGSYLVRVKTDNGVYQQIIIKK